MTMTMLSLVVLSLGVYRLARMLTQEDGPADAFSRMRQAVGQATWVGRGLHCVACVSFWVAGLAALALCLAGELYWRDLPLVWFGVAGGALVIYQMVR